MAHRPEYEDGPPVRNAFNFRRNAVRSPVAEAVVNRRGKGRFRGFSAGVEPLADADPITIEVLRQAGYATEGLRSKNCREFTQGDAPVFDFAFCAQHHGIKRNLP
jgi:arsenate reductase